MSEIPESIPFKISSAHFLGSSRFSELSLLLLMMLLLLIGVYKLVGYTIIIGTYNSVLKLSKKPVTANLEAQYAVLEGSPNFPEREEITTILPLDLLIRGSANLVKYTFA